MNNFSPDSFAGGILVGVAFGMVFHAWMSAADRRRLRSQRDNAVSDAAEATWRAAVAEEKADNARAEVQWWGGAR